MVGIKGYENKKLRRKEDGQRLRRTAKESGSSRAKKKLLAKTNWRKGRPIQQGPGEEEHKGTQGRESPDEAVGTQNGHLRGADPEGGACQETKGVDE